MPVMLVLIIIMIILIIIIIDNHSYYYIFIYEQILFKWSTVFPANIIHISNDYFHTVMQKKSNYKSINGNYYPIIS